RVVGEPDEPGVRHILLQPAHWRLCQLGQAQQKMPFAPRVVGVPAVAAGLAADARIEHVARGEVAIGGRGWRKLRGIALLAPQIAEAAESSTPELTVRVPG